MKKTFFFVVSMIFSLISSLSAYGKNSDDADFSDLSLEELLEVRVVTASKREEKVTDTPSPILVISKRDLQRRRYVHLLDLLEDLPGIDVQKATQQTSYDEIIWRGHVGSNKFLILQDGVRIDSPTGENIPIAENIPLYHVERVEILYGAAAALYGADAFGGVINIITEAAHKVDSVNVTATTGTNNYQAYYLHAGKQLTENFSIVVGGHQHNADTADLSKRDASYNTKVDATTYGGKTAIVAADREDFAAPVNSESAFAKINFGKNVTLGINHSFLQNSSSLGVKPSISLFTDSAQWNSETNTAYAKGNFDVNDHFSSNTTFSYATYEADPQSNFKSIFADFEDSYTYVKGKKWGVEQQFDYRFSDDQALIVGASYEDFYSIPRLTNLSRPYNVNEPFNEQGFFYRNTHNGVPILYFDVDYTNTSLYFQLQSAWNEWLSSTIGVRYDDNSRYQSVFNPRIGFVYRLNPKSVLKMLYSEAFRAPAPHENFEHYGSFSGQQNDQGEYVSYYFHAPNPNLEPEKSRSLDIAFVKTWQTTNLTLSSYYTQVSNVIAERSEEQPTQFIPNAAILSTSIFDNLDKKIHYGVEGSIDYHHQFNENVLGEFWGSYSFIDGYVDQKLTRTQVDLPYIATHKLKLGATLSYKNKYFVTSKIFLIDRTNTYNIDPNAVEKRTQIPGYVVADLHLGATDFFKGLSAYLDIYNLFDTHYYNARGADESLTLTAVPQQPRTVMFSLKYQF